MNPADYPSQEPLSEAGKAYARRVCELGEGRAGTEFHYGDDPYQSGLAFLPSDPSGRVLIFLHGGGWTSGYKEWMSFMAPGLTQAGVTFVSLGYRLAPQQTFPTGLDDVALGVKWVYDHASNLLGDPEKLFIGGHSAGGHYASLLAVTRGWAPRLGLPESVLQGCLPISGVYDLTSAGGLSTRPRFLGTASLERNASPLHNVQGTPPPFLIATGEHDFKHLIHQADQFEDRLNTLNAPVARLTLCGADHFEASIAAGDPVGHWMRRARVFMQEWTGPE